MEETITRLGAALAVNALALMGMTEGDAILAVAQVAEDHEISLTVPEIIAAVDENRAKV